MTTDLTPHLVTSSVTSRQWRSAERALDQTLPIHLAALEARPALESAFVDIVLFGPYPVRQSLRAKLISIHHPLDVLTLEGWRGETLDAIMASNLTWMVQAAVRDLRYSAAQDHLHRALRVPADKPTRATLVVAALTKVLDFAVHCEGSFPARLWADAEFLTHETGDLAITIAFGANAAPFPFLSSALLSIANHPHYAPVVRTVVNDAMHRASWPTLRSLFWLTQFPHLMPRYDRRFNAVGRAFHRQAANALPPPLDTRTAQSASNTELNHPA